MNRMVLSALYDGRELKEAASETGKDAFTSHNS
jgi:hypothetical protein